jgi:hypothetical protein
MSPLRYRIWRRYWLIRNAIHHAYARLLRCPFKGHRWATSWDSTWSAGYSETTCLHCGRYHPTEGKITRALEETPPRAEQSPNELRFDMEAFRKAWKKA